MKKILGLTASLLMLVGNSAWAIMLSDGLTDVGVLDTWLDTTSVLANSSEATETAWVDSVLAAEGIDTSNLAYDTKLEPAEVLATDTADVYAMALATSSPSVVADFFIIKNAQYWALFDNNLNMDWAVIDLNLLPSDMKIVNDWEVSHVTVFSNPINIPEPSVLALMGLGLLGLGFYRRERSVQ